MLLTADRQFKSIKKNLSNEKAIQQVVAVKEIKKEDMTYDRFHMSEVSS
tara:strand:+ start:166 stop:312 length:147 start_codon:yes stop_codon:yes gene_type:complete